MVAVLTEVFLFLVEKMPHMIYGRLSRYLLGKVKDQVRCVKTVLNLQAFTALPEVYCGFTFDNKTPLSLRANRLVCKFYVDSALIHTLIWSQLEHEMGYEEIPPLQTDMVENLKPKGQANVGVVFPLLPEHLRSEHIGNWTVRGVMDFESKIGYFHVPIWNSISIDAKHIVEAKTKYVGLIQS
jgi:hypothetical protein